MFPFYIAYNAIVISTVRKPDELPDDFKNIMTLMLIICIAVTIVAQIVICRKPDLVQYFGCSVIIFQSVYLAVASWIYSNDGETVEDMKFRFIFTTNIMLPNYMVFIVLYTVTAVQTLYIVSPIFGISCMALVFKAREYEIEDDALIGFLPVIGIFCFGQYFHFLEKSNFYIS
jgi:hypothetical protein